MNILISKANEPVATLTDATQVTILVPIEEGYDTIVTAHAKISKRLQADSWASIQSPSPTSFTKDAKQYKVNMYREQLDRPGTFTDLDTLLDT